MHPKIEKLLKFLKNKKVGVFCDDSNLYHSYRKYGWRVDFRKFKELLKKHCNLQFINYYVALPQKSDNDCRKVKKFLNYIAPYVTIKIKPLKYIMPVKEMMVRKGDVDVEK